MKLSEYIKTLQEYQKKIDADPEVITYADNDMDFEIVNNPMIHRRDGANIYENYQSDWKEGDFVVIYN